MRDQERYSSSWIKYYSPSLKPAVKVVEILHCGCTHGNRVTQSSSFAAEKMETGVWTAWDRKCCHWNSHSSLQLFQDSDENRHRCVMPLGLVFRLLHPSQRRLKSMKHIRQRIINFFILTRFTLAACSTNKLYNTNTHILRNIFKIEGCFQILYRYDDQNCMYLIYVTWYFGLIYTYAVKWSP